MDKNLLKVYILILGFSSYLSSLPPDKSESLYLKTFNGLLGAIYFGLVEKLLKIDSIANIVKKYAKDMEKAGNKQEIITKFVTEIISSQGAAGSNLELADLLKQSAVEVFSSFARKTKMSKLESQIKEVFANN